MSKSKTAGSESEKGRARHEIVELDVDGHRYRLVTPSAETDYIQKKLHDERVPYEYGMLKDMAGRLKPGELVLDVGANIGNHALYLAVVVNCEVIAFEPNESLVAAMTDSVRLNRLGKRLRVESVALGNNEYTGSFEKEIPENIGAQKIVPGDGDVRICPLDGFQFDMRVSAIKIDVEGMEMAVLEGGKSLIQRDNPLLYIECQSEDDFRSVHDLISKLGYAYWDTFNATPTHLFIHESQFQKEHAIERILYKLVRDEYSAKSKIDAWRARVAKLQAELDATREQVSEFRAQLSALNENYRRVSAETVPKLTQALVTQREELTRDLQEARAQLEESVSASNYLAKERIPKLERELEARTAEFDEAVTTYQEQLQAHRSDAQRRLDEVSKELAKSRRALGDVEFELSRSLDVFRHKLEAQARISDRRVHDLKSSLTYQIGLCFREASQSLRGLFKLPVALFRVWRRVKRSSPIVGVQTGPHFSLREEDSCESWIELSQSPIWQTVAVSGGADLAVFGKIELERRTDKSDRCGLVRIEYLDDRNKLLIGEYPRTNFSNQVGHYKYLRFRTDQEDEFFRLRPPAGARAVRLGFQSWQSTATLRIANELKLVPVQRRKMPPRSDFKPPSPAAQEVSILGWPEPADDGRPLVLSIMDEFTEGCFEHDLRLLQPRPDNWYALAQKYPPVMAFIESTWKGNGGSWQYRVGSYSIKPGRELEDMMTWAREAGVPSIFWNKEDPVHHEKFMEAASLADHVFTTDENMIESYKCRTGNSSVHALPFAAQPALHKPATLEGRIRRACFAGSWYGDRHVERGKAMKWLLHTALKHGLDIFDRNHGSGNFSFPKAYQEGIRGALPYRELCREYARYRLFLNVNSVTDSPTMFSRRVFELLACGTPVVSTYSRGLEELFESGAVWLVRNEAEADEAIHILLTDDKEWRRRSLAGIREVFSRHTYAHRINRIFEIVGVSDRINTQPRVLLLARIKKQSELERLLALAEQQTYRNFEMLVECSSALQRIPGPATVRLVREGELQSRASVAASSIAAIGWVGAHHQYGPDYLRDLVNAMSCQPDALGWAKATDGDAFRFGADTHLMAAIWQPEEFMQRRIDSPEESISSEELFCVDAEEFKADDLVRPARQAGHD